MACPFFSQSTIVKQMRLVYQGSYSDHESELASTAVVPSDLSTSLLMSLCLVCRGTLQGDHLLQHGAESAVSLPVSLRS